MSFSSHFGFWLFLAMKLPKYYLIVYLLFYLRKSRNQNDEKTKNEVTKICNEPGINNIYYYDYYYDFNSLIFFYQKYFLYIF